MGQCSCYRPIHWIVLLVWALPLAGALGCADGPFFHLKKLNPVIVDQWNKDKRRGPVYADRLDEFDTLREQIQKYPPDEKSRYINLVSQVGLNDTSSEIRRRVVMVLERVIDDPAAVSAVAKLSQDKNEKVRMAVAKALANGKTDEATKTLLAMASADKSNAVKLLATESLGFHKSDQVRAFLVQQLNEKSPATQASATVALKHFTGTDLGGDVAKWKQYMNGESVEPRAPSLADQFFSVWR